MLVILVCSLYATLRRLFFRLNVRKKDVDVNALPVSREQCWSTSTVVFSTWNKLGPGENCVRRPEERAWHTGHVYLCTQNLLRRPVCFTTVSFPIHFDWMMNWNQTRSHIFKWWKESRQCSTSIVECVGDFEIQTKWKIFPRSLWKTLVTCVTKLALFTGA